MRRIGLSGTTSKLFWLVVAVSLILYGISAPTVMTGRGDSDELIASAFTGSLPHPPGYPFLIAFTHAWLPLIPNRWVNVAANEFNALLSAFTLGVVFLTVVEVIGNTKRAWLSALVATLALAVSFLWWLWAPVFEVFALLNLMATLLLYLTIRMIKTNKRRARWLGLGMAIILPLAVFHQQLVLLWLPFLGWYWWKYRPDSWRRLLVIMVMGLIIAGGGHFWLSQHLATAVDAWQLQPGIAGWWKFFTRQDYSGFNVESGVVTAAVLGHIEVTASLSSVWHYLITVLPESWLWWVLPMVYGGGLLIFDSRWKRYRLVVMLGILSSVGVAAYFTIPPSSDVDYWITRALTERVFLMGFIPLTIWLGVGIAGLFETFTKRTKMQVQIPTTFLALGLLGELFINFGVKQELQADSLDVQMNQSLLGLAPKSRVICFSDISCFGLRWLQTGRKIRTDVTVVSATSQMDTNLFTLQPDLRTIPYPDNPFMVSDVVGTALTNQVPVYSAEMPAYYQELWQLNRGGLQATQAGILERIHCLQTPIEVQNTSDKQSTHTTSSRRDSYGQVIEAYIQRQPPGAEDKRPECTGASERVNKSRVCMGSGDVRCGLSQAWLSVVEAPHSIEARIQFAQVLEHTGNLSLAKREYRNVLALTQVNATASAGLERLATVGDLP